jgi:hypothetical protein
VLHTKHAIELRIGTAAEILPPIVTADSLAWESSGRSSRLAAEWALDEVLADSFPASDPPSWNPGIARPDPSVGLELHATRPEAIAERSGER